MLTRSLILSVVFWETRQVLITDSEIVLSKTTDPDVRCDTIVLHQVTNVVRTHSGEGSELVVRTDPLGSSFGRTYIWRHNDPDEFDSLFHALSSAVSAATQHHQKQAREAGKNAVQVLVIRSRQVAMRVNESNAYQLLGSVIIILSFLSDIAESELLPAEGSQLEHLFLNLDWGFSGFFLLELLLQVCQLLLIHLCVCVCTCMYVCMYVCI